MAKNKIDFLNSIELKVKDIAGEFIKIANISAKVFADPKTTFTVDSVKGFSAGDLIYLYDGTSNSKFAIISEINTTDKKIVFVGDYHLINTGGIIKKSDSILHVEEALIIYSKIKPLKKTKTITGDGSNFYAIPDDWCLDFSVINSVEYPVGYEPKIILNENRYEISQMDDNSYKIKFVMPIDASVDALMNYTTIHKFSGDNPYSVSTPDSDFYAVCNISAYLYLMALAARYGQSVGSLAQGGNINYESKADSYRRLAKEYLGQAASFLGISVKTLDGTHYGPAPAASTQTEEYIDEEKPIFLRKFF